MRNFLERGSGEVWNRGADRSICNGFETFPDEPGSPKVETGSCSRNADNGANVDAGYRPQVHLSKSY